MARLLTLLLISAAISACSQQAQPEVTDVIHDDSRAYAHRVDNAIRLTAMIDERIDRSRRASGEPLSSTPATTQIEGKESSSKLGDERRKKLDPDICPLSTEEGRALLAQTPEGRALLDQQ
ncbi:hypothetical protein [Duganella vulcania]|uniref:Secreted protein n=1 Tax=Duganella vulcania TaxID=2692166 RepID=A0A845GHC3_9BURK|nr:hypothetical protein [Duganella vulcania]MYM92805.1 hypothetical protein [Duganella vulcania]